VSACGSGCGAQRRREAGCERASECRRAHTRPRVARAPRTRTHPPPLRTHARRPRSPEPEQRLTQPCRGARPHTPERERAHTHTDTHTQIHLPTI
jgi:hypothetical protein